MKKKIDLRDVIIILLLISWGVFSWFILKGTNDNELLQNKISEQNQLITTITKNRDSIYTLRNKKYSEIITKYVDATTFTLGKRKISPSEMSNLFNRVNEQNRLREDSLLFLKNDVKKYKDLILRIKDLSNTNEKQLKIQSDSSFIYREMLGLAKEKYGFVVVAKKDSTIADTYNFVLRHSKADSSLILYKYFKNRLKETAPGTYDVDLTGNSKPERKKVKKH